MPNLKNSFALNETKSKKKSGSTRLFLIILIVFILISVSIFEIWDTVQIDGKSFSRRSTKLDIDTLTVQEVPKLKKFKKLETISIKNCTTDFSFLSDMEQLHVFSVTAVNPAVTDCSDFADCPQLEQIYIAKDANLKDVSGFSELHSLDTLQIGLANTLAPNVTIQTLDGAETLPASITELSLSGVQASEVSTEQFSQLTALEELSLRNSQIQNLSVSSPSLKKMDAAHSDSLKNIHFSPDCKNLTYLYLNDLPNLEFPTDDLLKLPALKEIHVSENQLTKQEIQKLEDKNILVSVYQSRD